MRGLLWFLVALALAVLLYVHLPALPPGALYDCACLVIELV